MPVVAVAGGTGKLGRAIVDAIIAQGKSEVIILAREANPAKEKEIGAPIVAVDYDNVDALSSLLKENKVDTVIAAIHSMTGPGNEFNLIKAAENSSTTKRYIPSIWGIRWTDEIASYFPHAQGKIDVIKTMEKSPLEWTAVLNGVFLDEYVAPKVKTYMGPMGLVLDIPNDSAAIPGSGNDPVVFTHTFDIAKFVAALLTAPKWEKESVIIGDKVTWNEFLQIAEEAKGVKFSVTTDSIDHLKNGQITELPSHQNLYPIFPKQMLQGIFAAFGRMFVEGAFDLKPASTLNSAYPEIKPRSVKQLVNEGWKA